jgi:fatty-acyl-CoA synthase
VECEYAESDVCLAALPLYHSAQMHAFTTPQLLTGATTRLLEDPEPGKVLRIIEEERITSFFAPPTVWINLLRHPDMATRELSSLRKIYYGAAIMPEPVLHELAERLPNAGLYNCYGQSEIGPVATVLKPHEHAARPTSAGRPMLSVETRVVDTAIQDVAPGEQGEIVHRSRQLLVGYWGKPDETREAFSGGWFHSGDVGILDEAGYLFIVDRIKDVINTGGVLVASREIEDVLLRHPAVSETAVIALPDDKWIEVVAAVVVLRAGVQCSAADLQAHAAESLARYKVPKHVFFADHLPRNTAGKILKRELRDQYAPPA